MTEENPKNNTILQKVYKHKFYFVLNFIIIFSLTFSILYLFGLVPAEFNTIVGRYPSGESTDKLTGEFPLSIKIPKVGVDIQVYNPATTSVTILDSFLSKGAVRYPGSGLLGGNGNIFMFGHSTGFKIVNNQAFKAFNGIQNLKIGDNISVFSEKSEYIYRVLSVKLVTADKALITFNTQKHLLTLSTCNSFGAKSDRYVVEAELVSKKALN